MAVSSARTRDRGRQRGEATAVGTAAGRGRRRGDSRSGVRQSAPQFTDVDTELGSAAGGGGESHRHLIGTTACLRGVMHTHTFRPASTRSGMHARVSAVRARTLGLVLCLTTAVCLAGCDAGATEDSDASSPATERADHGGGSETDPEPTDPELPEPTATATQSAPSSSSTPVPLCATPDLTVSLRSAEGGGAAGQRAWELRFENSATFACQMDGYAGVSLIRGATQIGAAAVRVDSADRRDVLIAPGEAAIEQVVIEDAQAHGSDCHVVPAQGMKIYPPHNRQSITLQLEVDGCAEDKLPILEVGPVASP